MPMHAKVTSLRLPLLGSTTEKSTTGKAILNSYLLREVSTTECRDNFNSVRGAKLSTLDANGGTPYAEVANKMRYVLITDNGC